MTIESPGRGRIAAQPVRKVIDPPDRILGAAWRAQAKLPNSLPSRKERAVASSCSRNGRGLAGGVAVTSK